MTLNVRQMALDARVAGRALGLIPAQKRTDALLEIARRLETVGDTLWNANRADLEAAASLGLPLPARSLHAQSLPPRRHGRWLPFRGRAARPGW